MCVDRSALHPLRIDTRHQVPDVERVAEDHGTYLVVGKFEEAIERAEELDERT
jgi:hypothetical protein